MESKYGVEGRGGEGRGAVSKRFFILYSLALGTGQQAISTNSAIKDKDAREKERKGKKR
jgi:hypothetical protein